MLGKLLILTAVALAHGRPSEPETHSSFEPSDLCPADLSHWLLPHEYDCTKFYYCEYGLKWDTPRDCAPGTEFSFELQVCVHPAQANCNLPGSPPTEAPTTTTQSTTTTTTTQPTTTTTTPEPTTTTTTTKPTTTTTTPEPTTTTTTTKPTTTTTTPEPTTTTTTPEPTTTTTTPEPTTTTTTPEPTTTTTTPEPTTTTTTTKPTTTTTTPEPTTTTTTTERTTTTTTPEPTTTTTTTKPTTTSTTPEPTTTTTTPEPTTTTTTTKPNTTTTTTKPTTSKPEILPNGCPADFEVHKLLPHKECNKFYYCNFGEKVERECAPGTHFNPVEQVCDWPENAGCEKGDDEEEEGENLPNGCPADFEVHQLLPHKDCTKFYYCNFGEKVERECAPGTHFNPVKQVCDWPSNAGCESNDGDNGDGDNGSGDNGNGDNGSGDNGSGDNGSGDNGSGDNGATLPNGCPADFNVEQLLPHADCGKFYHCVHGQKVERECAAGTHFNPTLQLCDWPWNAGCESDSGNGDNGDGDNGDGDNGDGDNGGGDNGDGDNGDGDNGDGDNGDGDNGNGDGDNGDGDNGAVLPNGCPADFNVEQLLPHADCGKFYHCVHGQKVERECAAGTHFNPALQLCDWPWNAGCESDNGNGDNGDGDNGDGDNGDGDNGDGDNGDGNNGDGDNGNGDNGNGDGDNGDGDNGDGDNGDGDNGDGDNGNGDNGNGDGDNGDGDNGAVLPNGCPADFNVEQLLPHADCGKFYHCVHGQKVERECAAGTHFNPALQLCDWPWNAGCESDNGNGDNGDGDNGDGDNGDGDNGDGDNGDGDNGDGDNGNGDNGNGDGDNGNGDNGDGDNGDGDNGGGDNGGGDNGDGDNGDGDNGDGDNGNGDNGNGDGDNGDGDNGAVLPNGCPADFNVEQLLPHADCGKFYHCVHGQKVERECAAGTHFNPALQLCDWPWNAGCESDNGNGDGDNGDGDNGDGDNGDGDNGDGDNNNKCKQCNVLPWANDNDCNKFWRCEGEKAVLVTCSKGLHFNAKTATCDFIDSANCARVNN